MSRTFRHIHNHKSKTAFDDCEMSIVNQFDFREDKYHGTRYGSSRKSHATAKDIDRRIRRKKEMKEALQSLGD